ncbi:MAG: DUF805 domain-containing protein [Solirubrobacteraceae bacterium]|nr:DUF805 domain-containing protein [Solirubrobacteraceae bacterium]
MSFQEAISDGFAKYVQFTGRSSRSAYWYWALFAFIVYVAAYAISLALGTMIPYLLVALALFLPGIAVGVRRLHDTGKSGWWYFIALVPLVGGIALLIFFCQPSAPANEFGAAPDDKAGTPVPVI